MNTHRSEREWLAVKEVAREARLHPSAVYRAIARGTLPALRLSPHGALRVHRSQLDAFRRSA